MKGNKIPGARIRVRDNTTQGRIYSETQGAIVSNNGYHDAIVTKIDGKIQVIDNVNLGPMPIQEWISSRNLYFENGIKNVPGMSLNFEVLDSWGRR
jgi:Papain fold toxin 2